MELEALSLIKSVTSPTLPQPSTTPSLFHSQPNPTKPPSSFFLFPPVHPPFKTIHTNPSSFSLFPSSYTLPLLPPSTAMNLSSPVSSRVAVEAPIKKQTAVPKLRFLVPLIISSALLLLVCVWLDRSRIAQICFRSNVQNCTRIMLQCQGCPAASVV